MPNPVYSHTSDIKSNLWHSVATLGEPPFRRVGHTAVFIPNSDSNKNGKIVVIAGANPSGSFCDVNILDMENLEWEPFTTTGFKSRYEHAAFIPQSLPNKVYIFGGADQLENLNDVQVFDLEQCSWSTLQPNGTPPSPRTYHSTTCSIGDNLYVFGGGYREAEPVSDDKVHVYNAESNSWNTLNVQGTPPKIRHGHVVVAMNENRLLIHGGLSGASFLSDLNILDVKEERWYPVSQQPGSETSRAAHGALCYDDKLIVYGGMNEKGALNDVRSFNFETSTWTVIKFPLAGNSLPRLDFASCLAQLVLPSERKELPITQRLNKITIGEEEMTHEEGTNDSSNESDDENDSPNGGSLPTQGPDGETASEPATSLVLAQNGSSLNKQQQSTSKKAQVLLVVGGMDTSGEIYDDCSILRLDTLELSN